VQVKTIVKLRHLQDELPEIVDVARGAHAP